MTEELAEGVTIAGRYTLSRLLGEGGMGAVWAARHVVTGKHLALKFLKGTADDHRRRFVQEARVAAAIRHPNVVDIHDVFALPDDGLILVMDLLEGEPLSAFLHRQRTLSPAQLMPITLEVLAGLGAAHAVGVVHRDMKPDNIFMCRSANGPTTVKLLDFGIAKLTTLNGGIQHSGAMTQTGSLLGTPIYMAPEQVFGEKDLDHRADFWSLGIVLYECLTGACPIDGDNLGQIFKMISTRGFLPLSVRLPALDSGIAALIDSMLSILPEDRPDSAGQIAEVIATRMGLSLPHIPEPTWLPEARRKTQRVTIVPNTAGETNELFDEPSASLHPTFDAQPTLATPLKSAAPIDSVRPHQWPRAMLVSAVLLVLGVVFVVFRANPRESTTRPNDAAPSMSTPNLPIEKPRDTERPSNAIMPSSAVSTNHEASLPTSSAPGSPLNSNTVRNRPISKTPATSSTPTTTSQSKAKSGPGGIYSDSPY